MKQSSTTIEVIGFIRSCFTEKFGIPRQPGLAPSAVARLQLIEPFNRREMVRGLEAFSHVWVQFLFHQAVADGWKATVRPPRLGGSQRKGIFATRSPHRPNFIGLSAVKLEKITFVDGVVLELSGVDLLDGTPVLDIKPYLVSGDRLEDANDGWVPKKSVDFTVRFVHEAAIFCDRYQENTGNCLSALIREVLVQDPRPSSQREHKDEFGMLLFDVNVRWRIENDICTVLSCEQKPS